MVISTLLGVYHELTPAELVVLGSVLSHVFTSLILTARWGGACGYPCSQMGKLGFRELRCFADLPITAPLPHPGYVWACDQCQASGGLSGTPLLSLAKNSAPLHPGCPGAGHAGPPLMEAAGLQQESRGRTQGTAGRRTTCWHRGLSPHLCRFSVLLSYVSCSVLLCLMSFVLGFCHLKSPD